MAAHPPPTIDWIAILEESLARPGRIAEAFSAFHSYSFCNQMLVMLQCHGRGLKIGPIATFKGWLEKGRCVRKGEKALGMWRPITVRGRASDPGPDASDEPRIRFAWRHAWFVLDQTDGDPLPDTRPPLVGWDPTQALATLGVTEETFSDTNGNVFGYAIERRIAINPLAPMPHQTRFHELAHVLLGHTRLDLPCDLPDHVKEVEAETAALLVTAALGLEGIDESVGYIRRWLGQHQIEPAQIQRSVHAAQEILAAGRECAADTADHENRAVA